ncbi:MAG: hypothetical protein KGJ85_12260 [Betaproteobacteria bacterium]|nr:hypothetical protein [Betaproteobacteria bacterium]
MLNHEHAEELLPRISVRLDGVPMNRLAFVARHNLRQGPAPKYIDPARAHLNTVLFGPDVGDFKAAARASAERYRERTRQKVQRKQALLVEGIISFSWTAQPIVLENLEQAHSRARDLVEKILQAHGHGANLVSLVYHGDESAPHYHFVLEGVGADGRALLQRVHRSEGTHLQDLAGLAFQPMGIQRGIPVIQRMQRGDDRSKIVHRSVRQLHADLPKELAAKQRQVAAVAVDLAELQAKASTTEARLNKARDDLAKVQAQANVDASRVTRLQERIKDYTVRLGNQRAQIDAAMPKPVEVTVVTGTEKGLLGSRPTTAVQSFYSADEVARFADRLNHALLRQKDRARKAEHERTVAEAQVQRLRSIIAPYPQLGWRLKARAAGEHGPEQGRVIHMDQSYVYAVEARTDALIEGPRPRDVEVDFGMVLEFDHDRVAPPSKPDVQPWGLEQVIAAIRRFVTDRMPSAVPILTARLASEVAELREERHRQMVEAGSDLAPDTDDAAHAPVQAPGNDWA